jgi:hypothetical protein
MKEHPTDKDLLKEGTKTKATPIKVVRTLITGLFSDLLAAAGRLRRRTPR